MKRVFKYVVLLILLIGGSAFGIIQYLHSKDQGQTTEEAADAIANAADAAAAWTRDKTTHQIDVVAYFGEAPVAGRTRFFAVRAAVTTIGAHRMGEVCASMPVVRDALTSVLFDGVYRSINARHALDPRAVAHYGPRVRAEINGELRRPIVAKVRLALAGPAALADTGCKTERTASRR